MKPAAWRMREACEEVGAFLDFYSPDGEGLCMPTTAAFAWALTAADVRGVTANAGTYAGEAHWWVEVGGFRVDATVRQFGPDLPYVTLTTGPEPYYLGEFGSTYPPGWTREQVFEEYARCFWFGSHASGEVAAGVLGILEAAFPARTPTHA